MKIIQYQDKYKSQVIALILKIQNEEAKIDLPIEEQPDLLDINKFYTSTGGAFWLAIEDDTVIGTIGLILKGNDSAILKKFFVEKEYRNKKIGLSLYQNLLDFAKKNNVKSIILDTPSVAISSHKFYEKNGFKETTKKDLPIDYEYPDRNSKLYILNL